MDDLIKKAQEVAGDYRMADEQRQNSRAQLKMILDQLVSSYNMTELAELLALKRTTLYYILWGKNGREHEIINRSYARNLSVNDKSRK